MMTKNIVFAKSNKENDELNSNIQFDQKYTHYQKTVVKSVLNTDFCLAIQENIDNKLSQQWMLRKYLYDQSGGYMLISKMSYGFMGVDSSNQSKLQTLPFGNKIVWKIQEVEKDKFTLRLSDSQVLGMKSDGSVSLSKYEGAN